MIDNKIVCYSKEASNRTGCNFYRIFQPSSKMSERGNLIVCPSSQLNTIEEKDLWFDQSDIVFTQITSELMLEMMIEMKGKKRFVLDWDDNIFALSPYNPAYKDHGCREVKVTINGEEKMLWEDGKNGFSIEANKKRLSMFVECMRRADLVTTPSPILSGIFKKINIKTKVLKNFIDFNIWNPLRLQKDDKIRIGWQGGDSHFEDWCLIKDAVREILEANKNTILVIMGTKFGGVIKDLPKDQVQMEGWLPVESYPYKFKTLNLDIGLAPLENNEFNTAKSELKWEEYSALEIPCVCSNIPPYSFSVHDGDTGFLCKSKEDWVDTLQRLINSAELRKSVGKEARKYVLENYDLDKEVVQYEDAFKVLCGMRKELILH